MTVKPELQPGVFALAVSENRSLGVTSGTLYLVQARSTEQAQVVNNDGVRVWVPARILALSDNQGRIKEPEIDWEDDGSGSLSPEEAQHYVDLETGDTEYITYKGKKYKVMFVDLTGTEVRLIAEAIAPGYIVELAKHLQHTFFGATRSWDEVSDESKRKWIEVAQQAEELLDMMEQN